MQVELAYAAQVDKSNLSTRRKNSSQAEDGVRQLTDDKKGKISFQRLIKCNHPKSPSLYALASRTAKHRLS